MKQNKGLNKQEVEKRIDAGQVNLDTSIKTRSIKQIIYENLFTLFNAVNLILAIIVFCTGSYKNMLFMGVIICNIFIGIIQEIRSKKTTDKLSIVAESKINILRSGSLELHPTSSIVLDDVINLKRGDQVPADCKVIDGSANVDESLLTGESDLIHKGIDDKLLSGSFISSGNVYAKVFHVGADNYATKITAEAKKYKKINSEIMNIMNNLIKIVSIIIFPLGAILFCKSYFLLNVDINTAILSTTSAMVGMIPEGLILLTSTVLAVSVVRLSKYKVLVQQLYCIETLARVDTLCLDKTGTITTGCMNVAKVVPFMDNKIEDIKTILAKISHFDNDKNETSNAILKFTKDIEVDSSELDKFIPFSSEKKFSGLKLKDGKCYIIGAAQFILNNDYLNKIEKTLKELVSEYRVIVLCQVEDFKDDGSTVGTSRPLGFVCIQDEIRKTAKQTVKFFTDQGVDLKVISGDDPKTVSGIAQKVGIKNAQNFCDATTLKNDEQIEEAINTFSVFGRVKPEQKKAFVLALQKHGHTVAMTGDGVNDTLALKASDCSVAMASGSSAARNVSQLVLVNNDFSSMTHVVAEGRRSINNLQRSASLFLTKTIFSMALSILFLFLPYNYPFEPIQLTLVSAFTIGIPSFVLALEPNNERIKSKFLLNVIVKAAPSAIISVVGVVVITIIGNNFFNLDYKQISTMCVLIMSLMGICLVIKISIPFNKLRTSLVIFIFAGTIVGAVFFNNLFGIVSFNGDMTLLFTTTAIISVLIFNFLYDFIDRKYNKILNKIN